MKRTQHRSGRVTCRVMASTPRNGAFRAVTIKGYINHIEVVADGRVVVHHDRCCGRGEQILDPVHCLITLGRRPAALDHSNVYRHWRLPAAFLDVLPKRFGRYGLRLHPEKTRLVRFHRPPRRSDHKRPPPDGAPGTFDLLGFTHCWSLSRKGNWVVKRKTASSRLTRALRTVARWCRINRHRPIAEQHRTLSRKLEGHFAYYGITPNAPALGQFRHEVARIWHKWLSRRRRDETIPWPRFNRLLERYPLPRAEVIHSVYRRAANP